MPQSTLVYGAPCWIDLTTSDLDKAKTFYADLFGWEIEDMGEEYGHYHIARKNGKQVGALMARQADMPEEADAWTVYFATKDAAAMLETAKEQGGQVAVEAMPVMNLGSMAVAVDNGGHLFGLWQPGDHTGYEIDSEDGAVAWLELTTRDSDKAIAFYTSMLGVDVTAAPESEGGEPYHMLTVDGEFKAGINSGTAMQDAGSADGWLVYFLSNPEEAAEKIAAGGGQVLYGPEDSPWGRFIVAKDPTGATFAVIG